MNLLTRLLFLAVLCACAPSGGIRDPRPVRDTRPTLLIVNKGLESLRVIDEYGHIMRRVFPGESACIILMLDKTQQIFFDQPFELIAGPIFNPYSQVGWRMDIYNMLKHDMLSLMPAERCK